MQWTTSGTRTRRAQGAATAALAAAALAVSGCSAGPAGQGGGRASDSLTVNLGFSGNTIVRNFNPFSLQASQGTFGFQYEALFGFNILQGGKFVPWLGTKYTWADGGKKITVALDPRANWSDGSKLTAKDAVYALEYVKKQDLPVDWKFDYKSATAPDDHTLDITFDTPAYAKLRNIGGIRPIPEKIWKSQDGKTFTNPQPVASGPYVLKKYSAQQLTFEARDNYWKQKVPVKTLKAPVVASSSEIGKLLSGEIQWSGGAVPDVQKQYVAKDPANHHAWYPTYGGLFMFFNHTKAPFQDVHVRKGLSLAVDRTELADVGNPGMFHPLNSTGLDAKTQGKWIDPAYRSAEQPMAQLDAAAAEFAKAGYSKQGEKLVGKDGRQLSFKILEVAEFADSVQRDKVIATQLAKAGIDVQVQPIASAQLDKARQDANFDVLVGGAVYYNTPYNFFKDMLFSGNKGIWTNYGHYNNTKADGLLQQMEGSGDDAAILKTSAALQKIMVDDVPAAPLITIGASAQYNSKNWTGWPDEKNPYAIPAPWAGPTDMVNTVLSLKPVSGAKAK
ncbi:ABC transporter substrate-binding protein [Streptomyces sp. NPDC087440]|uniref:ABC transporter substrate-binding protein n=1 Tax=Streptomyces sp. NPDC087440 TaxID=3365790 RepID=UPI003807D174